MERHANYALVGAASIVLLIAALVFIVWLGGTRLGDENDEYRVIFQGPVRGLSVGGEVQFNGIKMGQIQRITLDENDPNRVLTDIEITHKTPVRIDSLASTETQGISGVSVVQISAGTPTRELLRKANRGKRPVIASKPNALSSLLQGGGQMVESATSALQQVNKALSDENIQNLGAAVRDIRLTTGEIAANRAMFASAASALGKLDRAADDIQHAAASVRDIADTDGRKAFADISDTAAELKIAISEARGTLANVNKQSATIGATTLPAINASMSSLRETADSLDGLIRQIRQNPRQALGKDSGLELELPE